MTGEDASRQPENQPLPWGQPGPLNPSERANATLMNLKDPTLNLRPYAPTQVVDLETNESRQERPQ